MSTMTLEQVRDMVALHIVDGDAANSLTLRTIHEAIDAHLAAREADAVMWQCRVWFKRQEKWSTWQNIDKEAFYECNRTGKFWEYDLIETRALYAAPVAKEAAAPAEQVVDGGVSMQAIVDAASAVGAEVDGGDLPDDNTGYPGYGACFTFDEKQIVAFARRIREAVASEIDPVFVHGRLLTCNEKGYWLHHSNGTDYNGPFENEAEARSIANRLESVTPRPAVATSAQRNYAELNREFSNGFEVGKAVATPAEVTGLVRELLVYWDLHGAKYDFAERMEAIRDALAAASDHRAHARNMVPEETDAVIDAMCKIVAREAGEDFGRLDGFTREVLRGTQRQALRAVREVAAAPEAASFQARVSAWMDQCFLPSLYSDMTERGDRLLEEVLELLQSKGYDRERVATLVDYVFGRPVGEPAQEVGGVMVTLAGYCWIAGLDMHADGERELARINEPVVMAKIRAKQEAKNALHFDTPLPGNVTKANSEEILSGSEVQS